MEKGNYWHDSVPFSLAYSYCWRNKYYQMIFAFSDEWTYECTNTNTILFHSLSLYHPTTSCKIPKLLSGIFPMRSFLLHLKSVWGLQAVTWGYYSYFYLPSSWHCNTFSSPVFLLPGASKELLFDQGFVHQILLVYTDALGVNER